MSVYEAKRMYSRMVPETVSHFIVPSFPQSTQINPTLLIHADGSNGSTIFTDATGQHKVTASGDVHIDTSQSVFGGGSAVFDGAVVLNDYLLVDGNLTDFAFGTGDFTIDMRVMKNTIVDAQLVTFGDPVSTRPQLKWLSDGKFYYSIGATDVIIGTTVFGATGVWHHVAVTRAFGSTRLYVDGSEESLPYVGFEDLTTGNNTPRFGSNYAGDFFRLDGWLDEMRIIKGTAAWTSGGFAVPTAPYMVS